MVIGLLRIAAIICTAFACGKAVSRVKLPAILGWLIAGIVFGPYLAGVVTLEITDALWYKIMIKFFECFAGVMIGREIIFKKIASSGKQIIGITFVQSIGTFLVVSAVFAVVFLINLALLPLIALFAVYYSSYTHFGVTVLRQNFIGNNLTLESLVYGFVLGFGAAGAIIWFSCVYSVFSADKIVYLFGRLSPKLTLFLSILLRMVPRIKNEAKRIDTALQQTDMQYDPRIVLPAVTPASYLFFGCYAVLCLIPLLLELWTEYRFDKARKTNRPQN